MVRRGMRDFLALHDDLEIVGEAADGAAAIDQAAALRPDVVVMDLLMPGIDGIEATARIKAEPPDVRVVALTSFVEEDAGRGRHRGRRRRVPAQGRRGGRAGRGDPGGGRRRGPPRPGGRRDRRASDARRARAGATAGERRRRASRSLTARERDVLAGVARGLSNRAIADELGITERTARTHVSNILAKLGLASRTQAALLAVQHGLDRTG